MDYKNEIKELKQKVAALEGQVQELQKTKQESINIDSILEKLANSLALTANSTL